MVNNTKQLVQAQQNKCDYNIQGPKQLSVRFTKQAVDANQSLSVNLVA